MGDVGEVMLYWVLGNSFRSLSSARPVSALALHLQDVFRALVFGYGAHFKMPAAKAPVYGRNDQKAVQGKLQWSRYAYFLLAKSDHELAWAAKLFPASYDKSLQPEDANDF